ncbi:MAG: hypothetical protein D6714_02200 [Bacteroidetes bacterium]|nr:MAG: hypothetical protein D6714_02200 [Bacteroidota bacterium]
MGYSTDIETIKTYIDGQLPEAEKRNFERALQSDPVLKDEVAAFRKIMTGLRLLNEEEFGKQVRKWSGEYAARNRTARKKTLRPLLRKIAVAAGILLFLGIAAYEWATVNYSNEALVSDLYQAPPPNTTMGQAADPLLKPLHQLFMTMHTDFQQGNYEKAREDLDNLTRILASNRDKMDALSWKFYHENVEWTRVLLMLKTHQTADPAFKKQLDQIADDPRNGYAPQARKLRQALSSFWRKMAD